MDERDYLYKVLGVSRGAADSDIKRGYHKMAKQFHPDKNPEHGDKFKEISFAYEVLSDPNKRQIYDRHGIQGLKEGGGGGADFSSMFEDLFGMDGGGGGFGGFGGMGGLFGGMGGGGGQRRRRKMQDTAYPLRLTLEELYRGKTTKLKLKRQVLCKDCKGAGGKNEQRCAGCQGRGVKIQMQQIGPGIITQMQSACRDCQGQGMSFSEKNRCKKCKGGKTVEEEKIKEVAVAPGSYHGLKITLHGEGNQEPDVEAGDVIVVVQQLEHDTFQRRANDLFTTMTIGLSEALTGFKRPLHHISGRDLIITSTPGNIIKPDSLQKVPGEGMPYFRDTTDHGDLIIKFKVEFPPRHFTDEKILAKIAKILPKPDPVEIPPVSETVDEAMLMDCQETFKNDGGRGGESGGSGAGQAYDSDDEEAGGHSHQGPGGVQCQSQ